MASSEGAVFAFGEYTLDPRTKRLLRGNTVVPLTTKAFDTLEVLLRAAGQTVSKDELLRQVWPGTFVQEDTLAQNISTIRRALGETAESPRHLLTVPRDGYRFVAPVEVVDREPATAESAPRQPQSPTPVPVTEPRAERSRRRLLVPFVTGVVLGAGLAFVSLRERASRPPPIPIAFEVFEPDGARFSSSGAMLALSPDGHHLAFLAEGLDRQDHLWLRTSSSRESMPLPGTQDASQPFWSPDSRSIAFFARGALHRIDISGGEVHTICPLASNANAVTGSWSSRDSIVFSVQGEGLFEVRASGGDPARIELNGMHDCSACMWPSFLPDGQRFLFTVASRQADRGIYIGSLDGTRPHRVLDDVSSTAYTTEGYVLYASAGALVARRFDPVRGQAGSDVVPIADSVSFNPFTTRAVFSASTAGLVAYTEPLTTRLQWISRTGSVISTGPEGVFHTLAVSRTGRTLVAQLDPQLGTYDLWLYDSDWRKATRVTFDPGSDLTPVWSEDGARAVFVRDQGRNGWQLEIVNVDRPGLERPLLPEPAPMMLGPLFWKDDVLYYRAVQPGGAARIWMVRTDKIDRPVPTASADPGAATAQARISPNGRWLAYTMNVKDSRVPRAALFVRPWPSGEGRSQVASEGSLPRWRADGGELFFLAPDRRLMAATVRDGAIGPLVPLCPTEALTASGLAGDPYDVAADGQRFLIKVAAHRPSIVVISGWLNGAKR